MPVAGPDRDSAVDIAYITGSVACQEACGPSAPKSVTDIATRRSKRSANAAQEVPKAAAWPVAPSSMTMSAPEASSKNNWRSASFDGLRTVLRLLALCKANGTLTPSMVGSA